MNTRQNTIKLVIVAAILISIVVIAGGLLLTNQMNQEQVIYSYIFDQDSPDTETGGIVIYEIAGEEIRHHASVSGVTLYRILNQDNKYSYDWLWTVLDYSMTKENISPITNNRYITGKFLDPQTGNQIGHWTFDLNKNDFKEIILDLPQ